MPTVVVARTVQEALEELSEHIVPLEQSKFNPLGAYEEPLRSERQVELKDRGSLVRDDGVIMRLNLPEQIMLFGLLDSKYGPLEHGNLERQLRAAYSDEGQIYKNNVIVRFWVYTGEMGRVTNDGHEFGRVVKTELMCKCPSVVFEGDAPEQSNTEDYKFTLNKAGVYVPNKRGLFNQLGEVRGRGYWNGVYPDNQGRSVVRCVWDSDEGNYRRQRLVANAYWPLYWGVNGALGAWRKTA